MQRNFILTDVMKTGNHPGLENFVSMHSMEDQMFDTVGQYYDLHLYELDDYDRKFAVIDCRADMVSMSTNAEFMGELKRRCDLLHSQGFVFIKATPWESMENVNDKTQYPEIDIPHIKWTGDLSWFWHYMYNKHKDNNFNFTHDHNGSYWHKKHDFLYLNKAPRTHRVKLYDTLLNKGVLDNSVSYDLEKDSNQRIDKLVSLCEDLKLKCDNGSIVERGNKKWQDIYLQTKALRKHNYDTFFDKERLSVQINKTLELFLEFADRGQVPS